MPITDAVQTMCRHCRCRNASRARGLCRRCDESREVRGQYPLASRDFSRCGVRDFCGGRLPLPAGPTAALPGTHAKIAVLAARAEAGVALWHPADAVRDTD